MLTRRQATLALIAALALAALFVWSTIYTSATHARGTLTFAVLDIGQGDALYIESPTGVQVLVDAGPNGAVLQQLPRVMPWGDRSIDIALETHPDADHIAGFVDVFKRYDIGVFIEPGIQKNTATADALARAVDSERAVHIVARRGESIDLGGGARLDILYPDTDVSSLPESKANEGCVVARLVYASTSALLACDAPASVETRIVQLGGELDSDILKVAHHGSKYSSTPGFVAAVSPATAIISVGKNSYGHPTQQALDTLLGIGATILRTDHDGTLIFMSDGKTFTRVR